MAPGTHAIESENTALWSETSSGTGAFFRVDSVSVARDAGRDGGWMDYGSLFKNQGQCMRLAN